MKFWKAVAVSIALVSGWAQNSQAANGLTVATCTAGYSPLYFIGLEFFFPHAGAIPSQKAPGIFTQISPAILYEADYGTNAFFYVLESDSTGCSLGGGFEITNGPLQYLYVYNLRLVVPAFATPGNPLFYLVADLEIPGGTVRGVPIYNIYGNYATVDPQVEAGLVAFGLGGYFTSATMYYEGP